MGCGKSKVGVINSTPVSKTTEKHENSKDADLEIYSNTQYNVMVSLFKLFYNSLSLILTYLWSIASPTSIMYCFEYRL